MTLVPAAPRPLDDRFEDEPFEDDRFEDEPFQDEPFEAMVARCEPLVRRTIRQVLGRHRDEDDLTQEVFLRLAIRLRQPGDVAVAPWVRRVARNVAIDELRRRRPDPVDDEVLHGAVPAGADDAAAALEGAELGRIVHQAVRALPDRQRRALLQRLDGGSDPGWLGVDPALVGADQEPLGAEARDSLVARARRQLRRDLGERWRVAAAVPGLGAVRSLGGRIAGMGRRLGRLLPGGGAPVGAKVAALVVVASAGAGSWLVSAGPTGPGPSGPGPTATGPTVAGPIVAGPATTAPAQGRAVPAPPAGERGTRAATVPVGGPARSSAPSSVGGADVAALGSTVALVGGLRTRLAPVIPGALVTPGDVLGGAAGSIGSAAGNVARVGTGTATGAAGSAARTLPGTTGTVAFSLPNMSRTPATANAVP